MQHNFESLKKIYSGKKVFLSGHTGFKGSWMLVLLNMLGAHVKGFALAPEDEPNLYNLINGDDLCESVIADIRDAEKIESEIQAFAPDFVFHFAAQSLVRKSYQQPLRTWDVNVMGTCNILNAVRVLSNPCQMVIITTDKVYENKEWWYPYREVDGLGGYDPYSSGKAASEIAVAAWRSSFFNPLQYSVHQKAIATARAGNVIGGGDWASDRIIPDLVRSITHNEKLIIRNPDAVRPWEHVLEPLSGYLQLGAALENDPIRFSTAFNFGPFQEDNLSVLELAKLAIRIFGQGMFEIQIPEDAPHEAHLLRLDISKAIQKLKWTPKWNAATAVEKTMSWYNTVLIEKRDALQITQEQIMSYFRYDNVENKI